MEPSEPGLPVRSRLRRAVNDGRFRQVARLVQDQFIEVWYGVPPDELRRALEVVPPWLRARYPVADYLFQLVGGGIPTGDRTLHASPSGASDVSEARANAASAPLLGAISVLQLRLQGRLQEALQALDRTERSLQIGNALVDSTRGWELFAAVQAGNTTLLAGSLSRARATFTRGQFTPASAELMHLSRDCSIKLALIEGLFGDRTQAAEELRRAERLPPTDSWIEPVLDASLVLARAVLGRDEGALDTLELRAVGEMWPFYVLVEYGRLIERGGQVAAMSFLRTLVDARLPGSAGDGFPGSVLPVLLARSRLAVGDPAGAKRVLKTADPKLCLTALAAAEVALSFGQADEVHRLLLSESAPWDDFRQLDAERRAIAAAAYSLGGDAEAAEALLAPVGGAEAAVSGSRVSERVRRVLTAGPLVAAMEPDASRPAALTQREREVLALLVRGARRDRRGAVRLDQHRQVAGAQPLPQARRLQPRRGRAAGAPARARGVRWSGGGGRRESPDAGGRSAHSNVSRMSSSRPTAVPLYGGSTSVNE